MEKAALSKNEIITSLTRSPHGDLPTYQPIVTEAARREPEFLAHLIAWNHEKGSIRDAKIALPVYSLAEPAFPVDFTENSRAHTAMLAPREFVRAVKAARVVGLAGKDRRLRGLVEQYLRHREASFGLWEAAYIQHRASLIWLYKHFRIKPGAENPLVHAAVTKRTYPTGSSLEIIQRLPVMPTSEALGHCIRRGFPFLVVMGALGRRMKAEPDALLAFINSMSPTELATNAKALDKLGVANNPTLRDAVRAKLREAADSPPTGALLKASKKAGEGTGTVTRALAQVGERQITATGGIKGRWLGLGDKSGSMEHTIEICKEIAAHLARFTDQSWLCFYDQAPQWFKEVTGWTLERVKQETQYIRAGGGTAAFSGLLYALDRNIEVDGIWIASDCEDGYAPAFVKTYQVYAKKFDREPTLYVFRVPGGSRDLLLPALQQAGILTEVFDLRGGFDHYSLPNIIQTMQTRRWGLLDQIMETPLKRLADVFTHKSA